MKFSISSGIKRSDAIKQFDLLGLEWCLDKDFGEWIEIHLLGIMLFFDFSK